MDTIGIISGIVAFVLVIAIHEFGHLISGQFFGAAVKSFAIGFGPEAKVLFYRKGVRYVLNWIPFGGYVMFYDREEIFNRKRRTLDDLSPFRKLIIYLSGPLINIVFGAIIATGTIYYVGTQVYDNGFFVSEVYPNTPAESAQIMPGDVLMRIANQDVTPDIDITDIAIAHTGESIPVVLLRDGQELTVNLVPASWSYAGSSMSVGYGINGNQMSHREDLSILKSVQFGLSMTKEIFLGSFTMWIPNSTESSVATEKESSESAEIAGPVSIVRQTGNIVEQYGFIGFLYMLVVLNVSIAAFNLLPFPGLDGSHILVHLIEIITRKPFPYAIKNIFFNIGLAVMFLFFIYIFFKEIWMWVNGI